MSLYPYLACNFDSHDYTLHAAEDVWVTLTEQQVQSLNEQIAKAKLSALNGG